MSRAGESTPAAVSLAAATWGIIAKDLLLEWRARARINATAFFAVVTLLLFSFAVGPAHTILVRNAAGYLWLAVLLASTLSLAEAFRVENDNDALEGLRLLPVDARAIFLGKALVNTLLLAALSLVLVPFVIAIYGVSIAGSPAALAGVLLLGCAAISAPGTLYAAIAAQARARDVLLPLLMFPILVPALVGAVRATRLVLEGDPMGEMPSWTTLLVVFNVLYWLLGVLLFPRAVEE